MARSVLRSKASSDILDPRLDGLEGHSLAARSSVTLFREPEGDASAVDHGQHGVLVEPALIGLGDLAELPAVVGAGQDQGQALAGLLEGPPL